MRIGIVIPIYQTIFINHLIEMIAGTAEETGPILCVVNDGRPDVAQFLSKQQYPTHVLVLNLPENRCYAGATNAGWKHLTQTFPDIDHLGTINDDTVPKVGWLAHLAQCLEKYPRTAIASPVMETRPRLLGRKTIATWKLKGSDEMEPDKRNIDSDTFVPVINGFCFLARRDALEQVGYFDEQFCNGCEDIDLALKLTSQGWRMVVSSQSFVYHHEASSRYLPGTRTNLRRNHEILAKKWNYDVQQFNRVRPKCIAFCVAYNQEHFMEAWVRNAARYADELLVMYANVPWTYNKEARRLMKPDRTKQILTRLQGEFTKLIVIEGDWESDTLNRNDALKAAKKRGAGWLLIVDTDEFYYPDDVFRAYEWMMKNPSEVWQMHHIQFIKNIHWSILTPEGTPVFQFAIDLSKVRKFKNIRIPEAKISINIPEELCVCWHFSYLMPFEKLKQKFTTWAHAMEINPKWITDIWPDIKPGIRDFHPRDPEAWKEIRVVNLPERITNMFKELGLMDITSD